MSSIISAALRLELKPSPLARRWRWLAHLVAAAAIPLLQSPLLMIASAAIVLLSLALSRRQESLTLLWDSDGNWTCHRVGQERALGLAESPVVQPWLIILAFRVHGQRRIRRIVIFPDAVDETSFRRLRVRLRCTANAFAASRRLLPEAER